MKIAFDTSDLCTGRADGTTRYTAELVKGLPSLGSQHDWHFLAPCQKPKHVPEGSYQWHSSPWPKYWTQARLPGELFRIKPDILFMPIQQLPMIRPRKMKTIAVIHDLAIHKYSEQFRLKDWLLLHWFGAVAIREADHIIAVSRSTADDIAKYHNRTKNVHVVHHGVDHEQFYVPEGNEKSEAWQKVSTAYPNLRKPYLLYVGQIQPRKNLGKLVEAFEQLHAQEEELQLVIAGGHGWLQQPILDRVNSSSAKSAIHMVGRVPDELLAPLYWHAEVFVLPSLYEGFGMPVLEAMASGCPVVTSNVSSLPEIAGEAAILIDPNSADAIAQGIAKARREASELKEKGITQAKKFTWEETAQQTLEVINQL